MRSAGLFTTVYIVIGVLVAASVIGGEGNYFSGLDSVEQFVELLLAILLWPLVLLEVSVNIGDIGLGGGDSPDNGGGSAGGGSAGGGGGDAK